jgi:hypothetical protein
MLIDCDTCIARGLACGDCVVTAIFATASAGEPTEVIELDDAERDAVNTLAAAGLVPPLRLVSPMSVIRRDIA